MTHPLWELGPLVDELDEARKAGKIIVFTNGCFDVLHRGHVQNLEDARNLGDVLVVGLNSDASVRRLKGEGRPLNTLSDRAFLLGSLRCVDYVVSFEEDTPICLVELVNPHVLVKGGDYHPEEVVGREWVEKNGGRVVILEQVPGFSTTEFLSRAARAARRTHP